MATIQLYGDIGESWWWDEEPITDKWFAEQLAQIPEGEHIDLRINSIGGDVSHGLAIYNLAKQRGNITAHIDGYALSAASFIALAADEVVSPESSLWMLHNPHMIAWGNAAAHRETADMLDKHRDATLAIYRTKTGKTDEEIMAVLDAETWFTGAEALEFGLCDRTTTEAPIDNVIPMNRFSMNMSRNTEQRLAAMGWQLDRRDRRSVHPAASAKPPAKGEPPVTKQAQPNADPTPEAASDPKVEARLEALDQQVKNQGQQIQQLTEQGAAKDAQIQQLQDELRITEQFGQYKAQAQQLCSELKMRPTEMNKLFGGDRASAKQILASDKRDHHLFYIQEYLSEVADRAPGLPTEFEADEPIDDRHSPAESEAAAAARQRIENAWRN